MAADPRWLEILKASGGQSAAACAACGAFLLAARVGVLPPLEPWMVQAAWFGLFLGGFLALVSLASALHKFFPLNIWVIHWVNGRRMKKVVENYIPHMTETERKIIAYLLAKNQKSFTAASDGGQAVTLISRRIVVRALQPGQIFLADDTPFVVPDEVWDVLVRNREAFPYTPSRRGEVDAYPWRVRYF